MVTGSIIRRADLESVVPGKVIDQGAIEVRNATLHVDFLARHPSVISLSETETRPDWLGVCGNNTNLPLHDMEWR